MFRIPDGIDPKVRAALQAVQGVLYKLERGMRAETGGGRTEYVTVSGGGESRKSGVGGSVKEEYQGDWTVHGDLFVDGTIHGDLAGTMSADITPVATDCTLTRALDVVYQNSYSTMIRVDVSVEFS